MVASRVWFGDGVLACQVVRTGLTTPTLGREGRGAGGGSCCDNNNNNNNNNNTSQHSGTEEGVEEAG